ncbi:hypothetical protein [Paenibacillus sp. HW567]|uniref:hypothetical protein n=1 Tax=Paenibacillus sp. HW567 TaxID=1034769 RepID=UPI000382ECE7|nr:hypothetical protein [Paenibacillus sp. HW567]
MKAQNDTYYIALSVKLDKKDVPIFKKEIKHQLTQAMKPLVNEGRVQAISVYSHNKTAEKHGGFPAWDALLLIQIKEASCAKTILPYLKQMNLPFLPETIRMELLVTTPESTYPIPGEGALSRRTKPFYAVEYVDVQEQFLQEFQSIMISGNGPAMKYIMQHAKWCHHFYALETVTVFYHNPNYPAWNQIHVIGLYLEAIFRYKKDFAKGLELANHISFEDNFARLKEIRTMLFKTIGRKIV